MKSRDLCVALGLCGLLAVTSQAMAYGDTQCADSLRTDELALNPGYLQCVPPSAGRLANNAGNDDLQVLRAFQPGTWNRLGLSTDAGLGPFSTVSLNVSGSLTFDVPRADRFAIGLQASPFGDTEVVFYLFDYSGKPATSTIAFDTFGIDRDSPGWELQVAALYSPTVGNPPPGGIPEPATWALTLAGLCLLGAVKRGRAG